ncbi:MAG TPA: RICIN domain-containing protein [Pirellulales bacterium]|jgi:enterochelin esterase-like enzyme/sugar lactone lactonase YvrE|nr:RICIN domain-containing protein [Pirellulales bacterium]
MKRHCLFALVLAFLPAASIQAEDWGAYSIVPVGAPMMVLEAVESGTSGGTLVSINKPAGTANQKWLIVPKDDGFFAIKPSHSPTLALSAVRGGTKNGTALVLEADRGKSWQIWAMTRHDNGSYSLTPKHAPAMGIDDNGGKQQPGAKIDLWTYHPKDQHLQWFIKPLAGSGIQQAAADDASKYEPPAIKPEDIRPGETKQFRFAHSKIFPGTERDVTVFIPAQYDGKKSACVYVKTDGFNPREKSMMERMIATGEMPVTVGVFVRPGELRPPLKGTVGRRNRCFEYDGVSDNNVRFFTEELLPFVAKEYQLNLSTDGNDRCISGGSSGGIAAFTAAWHRPDAFSRVYAASGSWVAFRGGNEFPTMVRKFEAKPIRSFLSTGMRDMENAAGDWFLLDLEMDKSLKFSGYDYQFRVINGGHVAGYMDNYQEAMAYLWRGWPERVKAGPSAPRAQDILIPGENWQLVAGELKDARAAACNAKGEVFFIAGNQIQRLGLDGKISSFAADAKQAGGLDIGANGHLYTVSGIAGAILDYGAADRGARAAEGSATMVADGVRGHSILAMPNGSFYVTSDEDHGSVWLIKDGQRSRVDTGLKHPTGLAYRPDQWLLAVCEGASKWTCSYQIVDSGELTNKERFFWHHVADWDDDTGAEAVCYSLEGRMFVATRTGIQITADDGPTQVILPLPDRSRVLGVCLGGKELDTLFAFCSDKIWKRKVQHHAMGAFTPWTKVVPNKL